MSLEKKTLVIVPAFNEEDSIPMVVRGILTTIPSASVLVIDDGSKDETVAKAKASGANHVISLPHNLGIGGSVQTGFLFMVRHKYDWLVRVDGDGQHDPGEIPQLLTPLMNGEADLVIGSRFMNRQGFQSTVIRQIGIRYLSLLSMVFTRRRIRDITSGFRAYNRETVKTLVSNYSNDYPEPDEVVFLLKGKSRVMEVPVQMRTRDKGASSIHGWRVVFYIIKVSLSMFITYLRGGK